MTKKYSFVWRVFLIVVVMLVMISPIKVMAVSNPLDEIQLYEVCVDMRNDGTMDIRYHIEWKVLDDDSEGPLEWAKIGIPNKNVDEIKALSPNIKDIEFHKSGNETFVHVYFDKEIREGEIVTFDFSIHQKNMYVIDKEDHTLRYSFTPGWFEEIEVKEIIIRWNSRNVLKCSTDEMDENKEYYIWRSSLGFGEKINAAVYYNLDAFDATEDGQVQKESGLSAGAIILIIILVVLFIAFIVALVSDDYDSGSGFGGGGSRTVIYTGGRSSCACARSCACACACAGGGRAGCAKGFDSDGQNRSSRYFYGTEIEEDTLMKVLAEDV